MCIGVAILESKFPYIVGTLSIIVKGHPHSLAFVVLAQMRNVLRGRGDSLR